jgi:hypothetical protein
MLSDIRVTFIIFWVSKSVDHDWFNIRVFASMMIFNIVKSSIFTSTIRISLINEWINSYFDVTLSEERLMRENFYNYMKFFFLEIKSCSIIRSRLIRDLIVKCSTVWSLRRKKSEKKERDHSYRMFLVNENCDSSFSYMNHATSILRIREVLVIRVAVGLGFGQKFPPNPWVWVRSGWVFN